MDYKEKTKEAYNKYPKEFDRYFTEYFNNYLQKEANLFLSKLNGRKILDLGSGSGSHSLYFKEKGFDPFCIDISEEAIKLCKKKRLKGKVEDIENLKLKEKFDGVWANASLIHIPRNNIPMTLEKIKNHLKSDGIFFVSFKDGIKEGFEINDKYPETKRWFTYLTEDELENIFSKYFDLIMKSKKNVKNKFTFLNYFFKLKS